MSPPLSLVRQSHREIVFSYSRIRAVGTLAFAVAAMIVARYAVDDIVEAAGFGIVSIGSATRRPAALRRHRYPDRVR